MRTDPLPHPDRRRGRPGRRLTGAVAVSALSMLTLGLAAPQATAVDYSSICGDAALPTPPKITSFKFKPKKVDVRKKAKKVNVTVKANDPDGVQSVIAIFESKRKKKGKRQSFAIANLKRKSGSAANGTWKGAAKVDRHVIPGKWKVSAVMATDTKSGIEALGYAELGKRKWQRTLTVRSKAELKPPTITKFSVTKSVNSTSKRAKVTITANVKDNKAGVGGVLVTLTRADRKLREDTLLKRVKGNARKGTYRGTVTIDRWVGNAKWNATSEVFDKVLNTRTYKTKALKKKGRATTKVKSGVDTTAPTMSAFSFTPTSIAASNTTGKIAVTATLADSQSGVDTAQVSFTNEWGMAISGTLKRSSGSVNSGVWKGTVWMPCFGGGIAGEWEASVTLTDLSGNRRVLTPAQLTAAGLPTVLTMT